MDAKKLCEYVRILRGICRKSGGYGDEISRKIWSVGEYLVTADMERWIFAKTGINNLVPKPVECGKLYEALKSAGKQVKLVSTQGGLRVDGESGKTLLKWMSPAEDLKIPNLKNEPGIKIRFSGADLNYVLPATSSEVVRYALTGVAFDGKFKRMIASDGKRLNIRPFASDKTFGTIIIPKASCAVMKAILALGKEPNTLRLEPMPNCKCAKPDECEHIKNWNPGSVQIEFGDFTLYTKTMEGAFPDYRAVFPDMYHWTVKLDEKDLRKALTEAAAYLSKEKAFYVKFDMKASHVEVVARHSTSGVRSWEIKAFKPSGDTDGFQWICVDPSLLVESLYAEGVTYLQGSSGDSPLLIDGTSLCMPIRPMSNGVERDWFEKVRKKYETLAKHEKPIPFPTDSVKHLIPKEKLEHEEVMGRCEICGGATPLGQTMCGECKGVKQEVDMVGERKEFTLNKAPLVTVSLRKKKRLRDIQYDPEHDLFV